MYKIKKLHNIFLSDIIFGTNYLYKYSILLVLIENNSITNNTYSS
jgi:hypothetical protein